MPPCSVGMRTFLKQMVHPRSSSTPGCLTACCWRTPDKQASSQAVFGRTRGQRVARDLHGRHVANWLGLYLGLGQFVVSHTHRYLDTCADGIRHLWMPRRARLLLPDSMQARVGERPSASVCSTSATTPARFDLWCPDGMVRHDLSTLAFFRSHASGVERCKDICTPR